MNKSIFAIVIMIILTLSMLWAVEVWNECRRDHSTLYCIWMMKR